MNFTDPFGENEVPAAEVARRKAAYQKKLKERNQALNDLYRMGFDSAEEYNARRLQVQKEREKELEQKIEEFLQKLAKKLQATPPQPTKIQPYGFCGTCHDPRSPFTYHPAMQFEHGLFWGGITSSAIGTVTFIFPPAGFALASFTLGFISGRSLAEGGFGWMIPETDFEKGFLFGSLLVIPVTGSFFVAIPYQQALLQQEARAQLVQTLRFILFKKWMESEGIPILIDEGCSQQGFAGLLRANGVNAVEYYGLFPRTQFRAPGTKGVPDDSLLLLMRRAGGKIICWDKGRQIEGGFFEISLKMHPKLQGADINTLWKYLRQTYPNEFK